MAKYTILFIFIALTFFGWGFASSIYHIFPYDGIFEIKNIIYNKNSDNIEFEILDVDVESLIHISNQNDIQNKKISLINYIWKSTFLPNHHPNFVDTDIVDDRFDLSNLKSIDKIKVNMKYDVESISYLFNPEISNNRLIIYHQGHAGDFINGKETIQYFLDKNYSVLAFSMPLTGLNNQPIIDDPNFGKIRLDLHEEFKFLESDNFSSISYFLEPIVVSLNYLDDTHNFDSYDFVGISGGGWTGILYSAIDDRISKTYSIAGSSPFYLRSIPGNYGDYEANIPELYRIANYLELYILDSHGEGRELLQIFNKYDPCCFSGDVYLNYEDIISDKVFSLGSGNFQIFIDDSHNQHKISKDALNFILESLQ